MTRDEFMDMRRHLLGVDGMYDVLPHAIKSTQITFAGQSPQGLALFSLTQTPLGDRIIGVNRHIRSIGELES
ncbi:MAG: hypothetical protein RI985_144 [Chloroflexota bacterium]|jgi:hypothetical protein